MLGAPAPIPGLAMSWDDLADRIAAVAVRAFDKSKPGALVTYTPPAGGTPVEISGVFEGEFEGVDLGLGVEISSTAPALGIRLSDFVARVGAAPEIGATISIGAETFGVFDVQPDGQATVRLELRGRPPPP